MMKWNRRLKFLRFGDFFKKTVSTKICGILNKNLLIFVLQNVDEILDHVDDLQSKVYDQFENYETQFPTQDYQKLKKLSKILKNYKPKIEKNVKKSLDINTKMTNLMKKIDSELNVDESNCLKWSKKEVTRFV